MTNCIIPSRDYVASFDVDCQNAFTPLCPDELPVQEGTLIIDELNLQATHAKYRLGSKDAHSLKAIWIADEKHPQLSPVEGENVDLRWAAHAIPGTFGFELIQGLPKITDYDFFVWKGVELDMHPYGACYHDLANKMSTGVIEFLQQKKVTTIIVGGLTLDLCVKSTALQLINAGFQVIVNLAASRGVTPETNEKAIRDMKNAGILFISTANDITHQV